MNIAKLKTFPFHFLLLPLFYIWHLCNTYFALLPVKYVFRYTAYYLIFAFLLFYISKFIFRNKVKAGLWTSLLLFIFFFWGAIHDFIRNINIPDFITSYTFLLILTLTILTTSSILIYKNQKKIIKLNYFLNFFFIFNLLIEFSVTLYKLSTQEVVNRNLAINNLPINLNLAQTADSLKPDIFFIIFDEYASSSALKKYLNYDNSSIDSILKSSNFFVVKNSKSNYKLTPYSVSSTLNLNYHNTNLEGQILDAKGELKAQHTLYKSWLLRFLKKQGYHIKNIGIFDIESFPAPFESHFNKLIPRIFYNETFYGRIKKELWWMIKNKFPEKFKQSHYSLDNEDILKTTYSLDSLRKEMLSINKRPKFVITHLLIPHSPYYFDGNGNIRTLTAKDGVLDDSLYIDQVKFANKKIAEISELANLKQGRPKVVIIQGDHGKKDIYKNNKSFIREKQFMNLNAYFFSDHKYNQLYDSISPVNTFRIVLNKYFSANMLLLKDSTILHH